MARAGPLVTWKFAPKRVSSAILNRECRRRDRCSAFTRNCKPLSRSFGLVPIFLLLPRKSCFELCRARSLGSAEAEVGDAEKRQCRRDGDPCPVALTPK